MAITDIDEQKLEAFIGHAATELGAALNAALVTLGDELGLYKGMADGQPVTPAELAARTGTQERYVREWLNAQAASGFVVYEADAAAYVLPPEHALVLADESSPFAMAGTFQSANAAVAVRERLVDRFVNGEGVGWHEHHHGLWHGVERTFAAGYRTYLVSEWLPALDGVVAKLEAGGLVADVGCGHGASTILMAQAFPAARFVGTDYHADSIATARQRAVDAGVADRVTFEVAGAADYAGEGYDLVAFFDSFHDLGDPLAAARHAASVLAPDGTLHARRAVRRRSSRGQPQPDRPAVLRVLDARVHPRLALAARPCRARHPGRRGAAARGAAGRRLRRGPPRRRNAAEPRARGAAPVGIISARGDRSSPRAC